MPDPTDLARQFRTLRQGHAMTQAELSRLSGVARSEINRFERGWSSPTARSLEQLARVLGARLILQAAKIDDPNLDPTPHA